MRVVLFLYAAVCATSLVLASLAHGPFQLLGRISALFLSLPWCTAADRFDVREGSPQAYYFYVAGMLLNTAILLVLALLGRRRGK